MNYLKKLQLVGFLRTVAAPKNPAAYGVLWDAVTLDLLDGGDRTEQLYRLATGA